MIVESRIRTRACNFKLGKQHYRRHRIRTKILRYRNNWKLDASGNSLLRIFRNALLSCNNANELQLHINAVLINYFILIIRIRGTSQIHVSG